MTRSRSKQKRAIVQLTALLLVFLIGLIAFAVDTSWIVVPAIAFVYDSASYHSRQKSNRSRGSLSSLSHWPRWHRSFPSKPAPSLSQRCSWIGHKRISQEVPAIDDRSLNGYFVYAGGSHYELKIQTVALASFSRLPSDFEALDLPCEAP
jgi:hypothetical protein